MVGGFDLVMWVQALSGPLAYLGIFFVGFVGSASIILPIVPAVIIIPAAAGFLNPWLVGIAAGLGSGLGEITGYVLGRGGNYLVGAKQKKYFNRAERLMEKYGAVAVIFVFAALPLPFDVVGIICGVTKYSLKKFLVANTAGKILKFTALALAGSYGIGWLASVFG